MPWDQKLKRNWEDFRMEVFTREVEWSEWGTPMVPVPKKDGSVRICGDYKVTVNLELQAQQYPLPHIENIFPSLAGGQKFSKIDLRQAYHQLEMEEDSKTISLSTFVWACSVQPSSVRHHICTRYLAAYDWPNAGRTSGTSGILDDIRIIIWKDDEGHRAN